MKRYKVHEVIEMLEADGWFNEKRTCNGKRQAFRYIGTRDFKQHLETGWMEIIYFRYHVKD